eukprot:1142553-Pelagomonas_calceolata.AAC.11
MWNGIPNGKAADTLQTHPDLHSHVQAFEEERLEHTVDPLDDEVDLDNRVNQGFEGNPQSLSDSPWLSSTGCAIRKNVAFDFKPTNPQTGIMPTWQCEIIIRSVDLMKESLQSDTSDEVAIPAQMPEVITYPLLQSSSPPIFINFLVDMTIHGMSMVCMVIFERENRERAYPAM